MKTYSVYGPPGTGKTTEMLNRVKSAGERYDKDTISFLSFTRAGANEALKRLNLSRSDKICTIHSLMFRLNQCTKVAVVDGDKLKLFEKKTGYKFKGQSNDTGEQMEIGDHYLSILHKNENDMGDLKTSYIESDRPGSWSEFDHFCRTYNDWKKGHGYLDFNDILKMYLVNPVQHNIKVLFIDEAQDLSKLQWAVIEAMIGVGGIREVHIAGDDDQCIYEWAGANAHGMVEFESRFDSDRRVLDQSWRVPISAYDVAMEVINKVNKRVDKTYYPRDDKGVTNRTFSFNHKCIIPGEDTLILCRNFVTKKEIENELMSNMVPFVNEGGYPSPYESKIAIAIKSINKLKRGEAISKFEMENIIKSSNETTKQEIKAGDFKSLINRNYERSLVIPFGLIDFYRNADLEIKPTVRLSTIHSAKGREAEHVILHTGLTEKTIRSMEKNPDSEARVFYVATTRTKNKLTIIEGLDGYRI